MLIRLKQDYIFCSTHVMTLLESILERQEVSKFILIQESASQSGRTILEHFIEVSLL